MAAVMMLDACLLLIEYQLQRERDGELRRQLAEAEHVDSSTRHVQ